MTVIMSTASLEHAVYPLDEALAGAVLGYGAREPDLIVGTYTLGAVVTRADLLARSDI